MLVTENTCARCARADTGRTLHRRGAFASATCSLPTLRDAHREQGRRLLNKVERPAPGVGGKEGPYMIDGGFASVRGLTSGGSILLKLWYFLVKH